MRLPELRMAAIALSLGAGILAADRAGIVACLIAAGLVGLAGLIPPAARLRHTLLILAAFAALGGFSYAAASGIGPDDISGYARHTQAFEGLVASDLEPVSDHVRVLLRAERALIAGRWRPVSGDVMVNLHCHFAKHECRLRYGDLVRLSVGPYIPAEPTNPAQLSWKDYLARQGIHACASVRETRHITVLPGKRGSAFVRAALGLKRHFERSIERTHPKEEASLTAGVILGTYAYLPEDTFNDFMRTGTLHILAASGYNCFILLAISAPILRRIGLLPRWRNLIVLLLIGAYLLMVGPKPSLLRAAIMASLLLLAMPLRRVGSLRNLFFTAAFIVLLISPRDLFSIGFQLSFLSAGALIWTEPILKVMLMRSGLIGGKPRPDRGLIDAWLWKIGGALGSVTVGTVAITLVTTPIIAYYFNYISLVSIPANAAVALGVPLVFADAIACAVLAPIGALAAAVGWLGTQVTRGILAVVCFLGSMDHAAISVPSPHPLGMAGYYILLAVGMHYARSGIAEE